MAKTKSEVNKSEAIRKAIAEAPKAAAKEIVEALKAKGIETNEGLVYQVKRKMPGAKKKGKKRILLSGLLTTTPKAVSSSNGVLSVGSSITEVKALAGKVGGIGALKEIVDALQ